MKIKNMTAVFLALSVIFLYTGCSREGFSDAVNNKNDKPSTSSSSSDAADNVNGKEFDMQTGELVEKGVYMAYALPRGEGGQSEAASNISQAIHSILMALPQQFDLSEEGASLEVYDSVTKNDGRYYSIMYDGTYLSEKGASKEEFCFGLAFDSVTGDRIVVSDVIDPRTFSVLALDAQSSAIKSRDEQVVAQQRQILEEMGSDEFYDIITTGEQESMMALIEASFYLDGDEVIAVISKPDQPMGAVRVAVKL